MHLCDPPHPILLLQSPMIESTLIKMITEHLPLLHPLRNTIRPHKCFLPLLTRISDIKITTQQLALLEVAHATERPTSHPFSSFVLAVWIDCHAVNGEKILPLLP